MQFLISSRYFGKELSKIDFTNDYVTHVFLKNEKILVIETLCETIELDIVPLAISDNVINQGDRDWYKLAKLLFQVNDHPVIINIGEKCLNITFQY